jgi:STE24 endopeptidase
VHPVQRANACVSPPRDCALPVRGSGPAWEARSRGRVLKFVAGVVVGAALAAGAYLLYPTAVPDGLSPPAVDADAVFGSELVARAERYERFLYVDWVLAQVALLGTLALYARRGAGYMRESAAGPIGTGMLVGMLGLGIAWLVGLPFSLAAFWWARRHEQTELDYLTWLVRDWQLLGFAFLSISFALLVVMGLARRLGERWWLPGAAVFVGVVALFTFVQPYLEATTEPLRDDELLSAAARYERELGVAHVPVRVEEVSVDTKQANAYAYGLGPSRRVVLWDTLLRPPFDTEEQKVVLAHELAHHSQEHLPKGIAWFAIFAVPSAWILMRATRSRGGMGAPEAVPVALLVAVVLGLATAPAANFLSRRMEAEADWEALEVTRNPDALEGVMIGFAETSLGDPDPPAWTKHLLGTHPALAERVAMARAWQSQDDR